MKQKKLKEEFEAKDLERLKSLFAALRPDLENLRKEISQIVRVQREEAKKAKPRSPSADAW
ncbi:MAG: hypothetical protein NTX00_02925 [Candidatus Parcubacteria bacterium]|nr:hypothetical protein [Candidatus Parcubacteria bacterium]